MIYILFWTTEKHFKSTKPLHSKMKKIQGAFKDFYRNVRTFQGKMELSIQGLFKTVRTLLTVKNQNALRTDARTNASSKHNLVITFL